MKGFTKQQLLAAAAGAVVTLGLGAGAVTFAATGTSPVAALTGTVKTMHAPGVGGTVTAVSGNTITVTGADGKTYTIDATSAAITKDETVTVSSVAVGDTIMANGTVNGTSVTATAIHDGKMPAGGAGFGRDMGGMMGGRGVHGTVSAISGTTLTVTSTNTKTSVTSTYTVDASSATVLKGDGTTKPSTSTLSAVVVGDTVSIQGTVSGTSVTAKTIIDGPIPTNGPKMGSWGGQKPTTTQ
jgi:hypothetical protein